MLPPAPAVNSATQARAEVARARALGELPKRNCAAEAAALASAPLTLP